MRLAAGLLVALLLAGCGGNLPGVPRPPTPSPEVTRLAPADGSPPAATPAVALPPATLDPVGVYAVSGIATSGLPYDGSMRVLARGPVVHVEWQTGNPYRGVGVVVGNALGVAFGGDVCGVTSYVRDAAGGLAGWWVTVGGERLGSEQAHRSAPGAELAGAYRVHGQNPDGSPYAGELSVIRRGEVYQFTWKTPHEFDGVGVEQDGHVTVGWGGARCGVAQYLGEGAGSLRGLLGVFGQNAAGRETAMRQP